MKTFGTKILVAGLTLLLATIMLSCNKTDSSNSSNEIYSFISDIDRLIETENDELKSGGVLDCIYTCINSMPYEEVSAEEELLLQFVREEELLAHDVYAALYSLYPVPVFRNISKSETIHTTAIKALLEKYALSDPGIDHQKGVFQNTEIQALYETLMTQGSSSLNEALVVGAIIEDYDIADLINHLENVVDNTDIRFAISQLYKGSRNHLRAFHRHLTFRGITYNPQYISQELYDQITSSPWETGNGFCICQFSPQQSIQNLNNITH